MSEREYEVLKMLLDSTNECIKILDRLNQSQEVALEKMDKIIVEGGLGK